MVDLTNISASNQNNSLIQDYLSNGGSKSSDARPIGPQSMRIPENMHHLMAPIPNRGQKKSPALVTLYNRNMKIRKSQGGHAASKSPK